MKRQRYSSRRAWFEEEDRVRTAETQARIKVYNLCRFFLLCFSSLLLFSSTLACGVKLCVFQAMKEWLAEQKAAKASAGATLGGAAAEE